MQTHRTALLVLDEADQLLAPHFRSELLRLLEHVGAPAYNTTPAHDAVRQACAPAAYVSSLHCRPSVLRVC